MKTSLLVLRSFVYVLSQLFSLGRTVGLGTKEIGCVFTLVFLFGFFPYLFAYLWHSCLDLRV